MPPQHTITDRADSAPASVFTPETAPFSVRSAAALPLTIRTPIRRSHASKASAMSFALSDTGNTRLPRSVLSGTPNSSKNAMARSGGKAVTALNKNFGFRGTFARKSRTAQAFVTLQRPFPVMRSLRPRRFCPSRSVTRAPASAAVPAAIIPAAPPPITITSALVSGKHPVFAPQLLQIVEGLVERLTFSRSHRHDEGIYNAHGGDKRIHKRHHIGIGVEL